jgi:cytoskeletal protein RodZ
VGEFGDKFRKAREKKDISLDAVSNVTKISSRMLQAIEEEHFDQLPGGVFNKGFIRAYAKHLGLNDEEAVTDYLACLRQAQIDAHEVWEPERPALVRTAQTRPAMPDKRFVEPKQPAVKSQSPIQVEELPDLQLPRAEHVRPPRKNFAGNSDVEIPWRILAIAAVVVVLAVILWIRRSHTHTAANISSPAKSEPATAVPSAPASGALNQPAPSTSASSTTTAASPSASNAQPPPAAQSSTTTHAPAAMPVTSSIPNSAGGAEPNDVTIRTLNQPASKRSAKSIAPLTLVIRATETSWISILADGQSISRETLIAPAHASVRATHEIVARIGNAAGVTFLFNGQEIPADGAEAEVKTFVFDANGMRVVPSTQPVPAR